MKILVLGGCGYIGSHFCHLAMLSGYELTVLDDLSTGHAWAVPRESLWIGSILDKNLLLSRLRGVDVVCHFAGKSLVSESYEYPDFYYQQNVLGTRNLLEAMTESGVRKLVFSSSAAVYGNPMSDTEALSEQDECKPLNPYGETKLAAEYEIKRWCSDTGSTAMAFRYFNAAGALPEAGLGEAHEPETHLIPSVLIALEGRSEHEFLLYGNDYPTSDGTCVRDYLHVADISEAHLGGINFLAQETVGFEVLNLGTAVGHTNLEVIRMCEATASKRLDFKIVGRRKGDPFRLVASPLLAHSLLGWKAESSSLRQIVESAYAWTVSRK